MELKIDPEADETIMPEEDVVPEPVGEPAKLSMEEFKEKVEKLAFMKESGILTQEEFEAQKKELLKLV